MNGAIDRWLGLRLVYTQSGGLAACSVRRRVETSVADLSEPARAALVAIVEIDEAPMSNSWCDAVCHELVLEDEKGTRYGLARFDDGSVPVEAYPLLEELEGRLHILRHGER